MKEYAEPTESAEIKEKSTNTQTNETKVSKKTATTTSDTDAMDCEEDEYKEDSLEMATMTFRERMNYKKELQRKRIAKMDSKEKRSYILNYYKWHIIIGLFAVVCLAYAGRVIYRMTWPTLLELAIVNNYNETDPTKYITDSYREYYELDDKNFIEIYGSLNDITATEDTTEVGLTMSNYQTIGYYNMYDMLDVIICDEAALHLFVSTDDTTAIDLSMDTDLYKQIEDYVITMSDPKGIKNEGKPYNVALDISDTEFVKECDLSYSKVYLLIPSTKYTDNENTINFIKFVFGL
ncbi:MAG: hypothetical protein J6C01_10845 [Lachnospiraceae bacterium]|nr:hypothetical protein [Lachnospiraceae bacterium]